MVYALLTHAAGKRPTVGAKIYDTTRTPYIDATTGEPTLVIGDVIGVIQATDLGSTATDILFTTTNREKFTTGATVAVETSGGDSFFTASVTAKGQGEVTELSGTVTHIGNSNFSLSGTTADKRISIKYITRV